MFLINSIRCEILILYIYIYIYIYVCMYVCMYKYIYIYIYIDMISDVYILKKVRSINQTSQIIESSKVMRHTRYFRCFQLFVHISNQPCIMDDERKREKKRERVEGRERERERGREREREREREENHTSESSHCLR